MYLTGMGDKREFFQRGYRCEGRNTICSRGLDSGAVVLKPKLELEPKLVRTIHGLKI